MIRHQVSWRKRCTGVAIVALSSSEIGFSVSGKTGRIGSGNILVKRGKHDRTTPPACGHKSSVSGLGVAGGWILRGSLLGVSVGAHLLLLYGSAPAARFGSCSCRCRCNSAYGRGCRKRPSENRRREGTKDCRRVSSSFGTIRGECSFLLPKKADSRSCRRTDSFGDGRGYAQPSWCSNRKRATPGREGVVCG